MFLTKFDWLTPPVTLYYKGELQHSSVASSIMSLLGYCSSIIIGLYLSFDFFKRLSPQVFCFNRYIEDSGIFPLNSSSLFSYFQILDTKFALPRELDFTYIRVIGTELSIQTYLERNNTYGDDHWIYGKCNNNSDIKGLENLYNYEDYNQSYCIKKYFKKSDNKYYSIGEENFRWPEATHGTSHPNKTFYGIVFEQCKEDEIWYEITQGKKCKSQNEIHDYVNKHYVRFYMIDHFPDVYNYKTPFKKYYYNIDSTLSSGSYTYNHINFNPANIITHNGIFFDNTIENPAYVFDQNAQETGEFHGSYLSFYFWLKNKIYIYERTYKRLQDVLAEIEGMSDFIIFIATIINNFISEYITLNDTVHVLFTLRSKNVNRTAIKRILQTKRRTMFLKDNPPRRNNAPFNYYFNPYKMEESSDKYKINNINNNKIGYFGNVNKKRQILYKRGVANNNKIRVLENSLNSGVSNSKIKSTMIKDKSSSMIDVDIYKNIEKRKTEKKENDENVCKIENVQEEKILPAFDPFKETKLRFIEFAYNYVFFCKKKENNIEAYENFRMKIISEENLIQNYLDIHTLNKSIQQMNKEQDGG